MTWLVASASLFATWLNIRKIRACFAIWFLTNVTWAGYDFAHVTLPPKTGPDRM
jgi:hypothetical protein